MNQIVTNSRKLLRKEERRQNRLESSSSWTWLHVRITWQMFYKIQIPGPYPRPIELTCLRIYSSLEATQEQWFSKYLPRPAKSASPGSLLEIQIFGPHPQTNGNRNSVFLQGFQMIRMHSLKFWEPLPWDVGSMEAGTWSDVFIDEPSKALGTEKDTATPASRLSSAPNISVKWMQPQEWPLARLAEETPSRAQTRLKSCEQMNWWLF